MKLKFSYKITKVALPLYALKWNFKIGTKYNLAKQSRVKLRISVISVISAGYLYFDVQFGDVYCRDTCTLQSSVYTAPFNTTDPLLS
jgi:hypothetical protein